MSRIRGVFGYKLVSKSFIHLLSKYENEFLGWASCPTLPYGRDGIVSPSETAKTVSHLIIFCLGNTINDVRSVKLHYFSSLNAVSIYMTPFRGWN